MSSVVEFDRSIIENFLHSHSLRYMVDSDGDYRIAFRYDEEAQSDIEFWFVFLAKDVLNLQSISARKIPRDEWGRAILDCNEWNSAARSLMVNAFFVHPKGESRGQIVLKASLDFEEGIHQEFFDYWAMMVMALSFSFWRWVNRPYHLEDS